MDVSPLLAATDLHFAYADRPPILRGASFALQPGERIGLLGANGSGKSTLLHLLVGLLRPQAGTIHAFGREPQSEADFAQVRTRLGLVFQNPDDQLFCPTVLDDVAFGPLNLGRSPDEARGLAAESLRTVGLAGFEERITYKLSGGEKQLVALATVLAMEPTALLLDEPVAGLDARARDRVREVLRHLPQALILVSHDQALVRDLTTRTLTLADGRIA